MFVSSCLRAPVLIVGLHDSGACKCFFVVVLRVCNQDLESISLLGRQIKKMAPSSRGVAWFRDGWTFLLSYLVMDSLPVCQDSDLSLILNGM